MSKTTIILFVK